MAVNNERVYRKLKEIMTKVAELYEYIEQEGGLESENTEDSYKEYETINLKGSPHFGNISNLLTSGFSENELRNITRYNPKFTGLAPRLANLQNKSSIVSELIDYAKERNIVEELLGWAKSNNPNMYAQYTYTY